jgi:hypothetical protein
MAPVGERRSPRRGAPRLPNSGRPSLRGDPPANTPGANSALSRSSAPARTLASQMRCTQRFLTKGGYTYTAITSNHARVPAPRSMRRNPRRRSSSRQRKRRTESRRRRIGRARRKCRASCAAGTSRAAAGAGPRRTRLPKRPSQTRAETIAMISHPCEMTVTRARRTSTSNLAPVRSRPPAIRHVRQLQPCLEPNAAGCSSNDPPDLEPRRPARRTPSRAGQDVPSVPLP